MLIYVFLVFLLLLFRIIFQKKDKYFCVSAGLLLYLIVALRSISLGINDTSGVYLSTFYQALNSTWKQLFTFILPDRVPFLFLTKFITIFTKNYHVYLAILAVPYIFSVTKLINDYSRMKLLSFICFLSLYYFYSFFLLRQVLAMSFTIWSYKYIKEGNITKFILCVIVASLFHITALIFLLAYPFARKNKFGLKNYLYILVSLLISYYAAPEIIKLIGQFIPKLGSWIYNGVYSTDKSVSMFGLFITVSILAFCHITRKRGQENSDILYNLSTLGSIIFALSNVVAEFYRVSIYFSIFNVLLISETIPKLTIKNNRIILLIGIIIFLLLYLFLRTINNVNANPYVFYWADNI